MQLNKDEWYDVYRFLRGDASREEFEEDWRAFQRAKEGHEAQVKIQ